MREFLIERKQFILIGFLWVIVGVFMGPVHLVVIPLMILLMYSKGLHIEIFLGFFLILTLSDSRLYQLSFAADSKNIYLVLLFLISIKERKHFNSIVLYYKYFIPFFIIAFFCIFYSPNKGLAFQKTLSYLLLLITIPNYFLFVYKQYGSRFLKDIVFLAVFILTLGLIINLVFPNITHFAGRYRGLLGNPNAIGIYCVLLLMFFIILNEYCVDLFTRNQKWFVYSVTFLSLLSSGARTSTLAILLFLFFRKFYKISPWLGFFIFIIIMLVYQIVSLNLVSIITSLGLGEALRVDTIANGSGRIIAWEFAWQQIQENFFIGKGFNYTDYIFYVNHERLSLLGHQGSAHNMFLTFWLDTGLVGLLFYLSALLIVFIKASKKSNLAIPVFYSVLLLSNYESWLTASLNPFTIQLLFILTFLFIKDDNAEPSMEIESKTALS